MEDNKKLRKKENEHLPLKNLSPEQWEELPEWEDLSQEIDLLVDNKYIDY